ncbi:restriction system-associated AAA family ATPase [Poseidonibacter ostreae]|uniref:Restriction system-associated AAA family ATPase n=1 Tax=Poseidonibacter ostreae TaxID=2654171 RepID=A0ABQ6VLU5_9BACT|nr:restriction system-associated AAA family ATPase [Poseidonibacter ostreae]KAB7886400.1 restriction system-associated AAA family ATPase [Poseidonibacter ostreae]KAB7891559.1 restriction system-associated AAA family ATPase [Poseidonibacter ostreae]
MKLLSLKINQQYKSLNDFDYTFRVPNSEYNEFEPICLVGLNGSGKSNIIEALSEIFAYLDLYTLEYEKVPQWARKSPLSFEIEYLLTFISGKIHVKISCLKGKYPKFSTIDEFDEVSEVDISKDLLPTLIIGYSSGHNESISYPYLKNQGFYAEEVLQSAKAKKEEPVAHTRTLFMDYEVNSLIFITNYLFSKDTSAFKQLIRVDQPFSFQININLDKVIITSELYEIIHKLTNIANYKEGDLILNWQLHFLLNHTTQKAVQDCFESESDFFTSLYKLTLLNAIRLTKPERQFYIKELKEGSLLREKPPVVSKENKVFNIDELIVKLSSPAIDIGYSGLSDGEHQFIHIIGTIMLFNQTNCLFLLDEPESHFNPQWRSQFINIISKTITHNNSEFILSTHSPYVVSAAKKENVLKFTREEEVITYKEPTRETFGAAFEEILLELFDVNTHISTYSEKYIEKLINEQDLSKMEKSISNIANSSVKQYLYQEILRLRKSGNK